jgi:hypothetical protein
MNKRLQFGYKKVSVAFNCILWGEHLLVIDFRDSHNTLHGRFHMPRKNYSILSSNSPPQYIPCRNYSIFSSNFSPQHPPQQELLDFVEQFFANNPHTRNFSTRNFSPLKIHSKSLITRRIPSALFIPMQRCPLRINPVLLEDIASHEPLLQTDSRLAHRQTHYEFDPL